MILYQNLSAYPFPDLCTQVHSSWQGACFLIFLGCFFAGVICLFILCFFNVNLEFIRENIIPSAFTDITKEKEELDLSHIVKEKEEPDFSDIFKGTRAPKLSFSKLEMVERAQKYFAVPFYLF